MSKSKPERTNVALRKGAKPERLPEPVQQEFRAVVKWTLTREENAAITIQKLSYRISQDSELAIKARSYAVVLKYYIARVKSQLPPDPSWPDCVSTHDALTETIIQSLDPEKAKSVLIRFLLQHAETASDTVMFAADKLNATAIHRLWRKADKERAKIVKWLEKQENLRMKNPDDTPSAKEEKGRSTEADADRPPMSAADTRGFEVQDARRISYNPPQIVIWM